MTKRELSGSERCTIINGLQVAAERFKEDAVSLGEFADKEAANHTQANGLVLDAKAHPALAAAQFKLLIAQLSLIAQATGEVALRKGLEQNKTDVQTELDVLALIVKPKSEGA